MENHGWVYYNHSLLSARAPHNCPDVEALDSRAFWKSFNGRPLFAVWTTDYDCEEQTEWWYCVCDKPFDISSLKSKRRNTIRNAIKYCRVEICDPLDYEEELFDVFTEAQNSYSLVNQINLSREKFHKDLNGFNDDDSVEVYICFLRETGEAAGYSVVKRYDSYCSLQSQKAKPRLEKYQVNAALVNAVLEHYSDKLGKDYYISDGARNINHITGFQGYLEKYFGFKKAYCRLHIRYKALVHFAITVLYPFRNVLKKLDKNRTFHLVNSVLVMESIRRSCNE